MSEAGTTRIVVNADDSWDFRGLARTKALDLYPAANLVHLRCADARPEASSLDRLLGAFPEDFSRPDSGLSEDIASEVRELIVRDRARMALLIVLSAADFLALARDPGSSRSPAERLRKPKELSPAGAMALDALYAALDQIQREEDTPDQISPARLRFWAMIVVRDLGHREAQDMATATKALQHCDRWTKVPLTAVVFLSNGDAGNRQGDAETIQFFKLRVLLDLLVDVENWRRLRAPAGGGRTLWITLPGSQRCPPLVSEYLARELRIAMEAAEADDRTEAAPEEDRLAAQALEKLTSELKAIEDEGAGTARARIKRAIAEEPDRVDDSAEVLGAKYDHSDMTAAIDKLRSERGGWFLRSQRFVDRVRLLAPEFDAAFRSATTSHERVTDALLGREGEQTLARRRRIIDLLDNYHAPRSPEGRAEQARMLADLRKRGEALAASVASARAARGVAVAALEKAAAERPAAFAAVAASEDNMLRGRSFMHMGLAVLAFLAPPVAWELARWSNVDAGFDLQTSLALVAENYLPLIAAVVVLSGVIMIMVGLRLRTKRELAQLMLADRMTHDWSGVVTASADRLVAGVNRRIASVLRISVNRMADAGDLAQADQLTEFLRLLRSAERPDLPEVREVDSFVARHVSETMSRGSGGARRVRAVLSGFSMKAPASVEIEAGDIQGRPIELATAAVAERASLAMKRGGGDYL